MVSNDFLQLKVRKTVCNITLLAALFLLGLVAPCSALQLLGDGLTPGENTHPHNLSSLRQGGGIHAQPGETDQICIFCHTPHSASSDGPLWNRTDPLGPNGDGSFPLYGELSGRLGEIAIDDLASGAQYGVDYPNGASRLCLSCHDGVTAIGEVINGGWSGSNLASLTMSARGTINLDTSHPISFVYSTSVANFIERVDQQNVPGTYLVPALTSGYLEKGSDGLYRVQCTTCHDPHIDTAHDGTYGLPMWRDYSGPTAENADYEKTCGACHVGGSGSAGLDANAGTPPGPTNVHTIP